MKANQQIFTILYMVAVMVRIPMEGMGEKTQTYTQILYVALLYWLLQISSSMNQTTIFRVWNE